jgi:hypothetical protein
MRKFALAVAISALVLLFAGCPASGPAPGGSLTINLPLLPLIPGDAKQRDLTLAQSYDVSGTGPGTSAFQEKGITDNSVTVDSLVPGPWDVAVYARNSAGLQVGAAYSQVTVVNGETVTADVSADVTVSDGTLDLQMQWPESRGISPAGVWLAPGTGGPQLAVALPPVATVNGVSSVSAVSAVAPGYYTLTRVFSDGTGGANALRIVSGAATKFALSVVKEVSVSITPDIPTQIPVTFGGNKSTLGKGASMTVTATPATSKQFNSFSFQWYLNGTLIRDQTEGSITISGTDHLGGNYRLDVVVASQGVLSSDGVFFTIAGQ